MLVFFLANRDLFTHSESIFLYWIKLGVLLKLEEMFGTNIVNVLEPRITGRVVRITYPESLSFGRGFESQWVC